MATSRILSTNATPTAILAISRTPCVADMFLGLRKGLTHVLLLFEPQRNTTILQFFYKDSSLTRGEGRRIFLKLLEEGMEKGYCKPSGKIELYCAFVETVPLYQRMGFRFGNKGAPLMSGRISTVIKKTKQSLIQ